jgi:hypothetical protein
MVQHQPDETSLPLMPRNRKRKKNGSLIPLIPAGNKKMFFYFEIIAGASLTGAMAMMMQRNFSGHTAGLALCCVNALHHRYTQCYSWYQW